MHDVIIPDGLITQEMSNEIMRTMPNAFHGIPDQFKTQEMCIKAVEDAPEALEYVPNQLKDQRDV